MLLLAALLLPLVAYARTPLERLGSSHLEAVHNQRIEWIKNRGILEPFGVYQDYRAVFTREQASRRDLSLSAVTAGADIVFSSATEPGIEDRVLFLKPPPDDLPLIELPHRAPVKDLPKWQRFVRRGRQYPEEGFGTATEVQREALARWDEVTATQPLTAYVAASPSENGVVTRAVAFRDTTTHILAKELKADDVLESLREGHAYVAHDWLCDPTGFRFFAENNLGVFEMGDTVGTGPLAGQTLIAAAVSIPAHLKLIHNGTTVAEVDNTVLEYPVRAEGAYRLEAWLNVDGESRPWIFSNPLYVRRPWDIRLPSTATPSNVEVLPDITYVDGAKNDEAKHKLDLYIPRDRKNAPVLVFLHGGSWMSGDRSLYKALGNRLAREGIAVAIPSYRLMPRNAHPAQMEDAAAAFDWVYRNIAQYGGDVHKIYVAGHSSGGHLVSLLALDPSYLAKYDLTPNAIHGVISLSGVYDVRRILTFRAEGDKRDASPVYKVHRNVPKFLIAYCQWDYLGLPRQARDFTSALKKAFVDAQLLYLPKESHITEIISVAKEESPLLKAILSFIE